MTPVEPFGAAEGLRVLRRPLRQPSGEEHVLLLLAGWSTTDTRGVYERGGRRVWWQRATRGGAAE